MNTDYVLVGGEYMEDGLSQNLWLRLKANPRYSMLNLSERISQKTYTSPQEKKRFIKMYWDIARSAPHIPFSEKLAGLHWRDNISYLGTKIFGKVKSLFK